jgi:hypothetical protein
LKELLRNILRPLLAAYRIFDTIVGPLPIGYKRTGPRFLLNITDAVVQKLLAARRVASLGMTPGKRRGDVGGGGGGGEEEEELSIEDRIKDVCEWNVPWALPLSTQQRLQTGQKQSELWREERKKLHYCLPDEADLVIPSTPPDLVSIKYLKVTEPILDSESFLHEPFPATTKASVPIPVKPPTTAFPVPKGEEGITAFDVKKPLIHPKVKPEVEEFEMEPIMESFQKFNITENRTTTADLFLPQLHTQIVPAPPPPLLPHPAHNLTQEHITLVEAETAVMEAVVMQALLFASVVIVVILIGRGFLWYKLDEWFRSQYEALPSMAIIDAPKPQLDTESEGKKEEEQGGAMSPKRRRASAPAVLSPIPGKSLSNELYLLLPLRINQR